MRTMSLVVLLLASMVSASGVANQPAEIIRRLRVLEEANFDEWKTAPHKSCLPDPDTFAVAFKSDECKSYIAKDNSITDSMTAPQIADLICGEGVCLAKLMAIFDPPQESAACGSWWDGLDKSVGDDQAKAQKAIDDLAISSMIKVMCSSRGPGVRCSDMIEVMGDPTKHELTKPCAAQADGTEKLCCMFSAMGCCWGSLANFIVKTTADATAQTVFKKDVMEINKTCSVGGNMCPNPFEANKFLTVEFQLANFLFAWIKALMQDMQDWLDISKGVSLNVVPLSSRSGSAVTVKVQAEANTGSDSLKTKMESAPTLTKTTAKNGGSNVVVTAGSLKAPVESSTDAVGSASTASVSFAVVLALAHLF